MCRCVCLCHVDSVVLCLSLSLSFYLWFSVILSLFLSPSLSPCLAYMQVCLCVCVCGVVLLVGYVRPAFRCRVTMLAVTCVLVTWGGGADAGQLWWCGAAAHGHKDNASVVHRPTTCVPVGAGPRTALDGGVVPPVNASTHRLAVSEVLLTGLQPGVTTVTGCIAVTSGPPWGLASGPYVAAALAATAAPFPVDSPQAGCHTASVLVAATGAPPPLIDAALDRRLPDPPFLDAHKSVVAGTHRDAAPLLLPVQVTKVRCLPFLTCFPAVAASPFF